MQSFRTAVLALGISIASVPAAVLVVPAVAIAAPQQQLSATVVGNPAAIAQLASVALSEQTLAAETGDSSASERYVAARNQLANDVALALKVDPARMQAAWATADSAHQTALLAALSQVGVPYRRNASVAGQAFDCSGLTSYAWGVAGVKLTHQSRSQINAAKATNLARAQAGDLVFYPGHVSMYLGVDRAIVHAVGSGRFVEIGHSPTRRNLRLGDPAA